METRPALSCCHICLLLKKKPTGSIKLKVRKSDFSLEINEKIFQIKFEEFVADPLTLMGLKTTERYLNFRIQVEPKFTLKSIVVSEPTPPFATGDSARLTCLCFNHLTKEIFFERVLPLPSNDVNLSDMFCHLHNAPTTESILSPKPGDCFFSDQVVAVSEGTITGCYKTQQFLKCKRCLATVGVIRNKSLNFWTSCLHMASGNLSSLERLQNIVKKVVSDPFALFPHILLEAEETENYLSVIVIDKNLILTKCRQDLNPSSKQVVKVKYTYYPSYDTQVKSLKSDPFSNLHHIEVDKAFLEYALTYLTCNSKSIPLLFSKMEGAFMAYLNLYD
ncbi:hypothetical protein RUM44_007452 [Polyplax serrata]|uniref:HECT-type E3 ubiquitin transferase E3D n=1 Tax=Polyplax serrata TaxID=468196 RepID=A0ABR1B0P5_POLSC